MLRLFLLGKRMCALHCCCFELGEHRLGLAFFVGFVGPEGEAVAFVAGDEVDVRVVNELAGVFAVVHHHIDAVAGEAFFEQKCDFACSLARGGPILGGNIENSARPIGLRNDECVPRHDRMNIKERQRLFIFIHLVRRNFPTHDLTENTVLHRYSVAIAQNAALLTNINASVIVSVGSSKAPHGLNPNTPPFFVCTYLARFFVYDKYQAPRAESRN